MGTKPFEGTARYYSEYRLDYPKEMLQLIEDAFGLDGTGTLLDAGCGTGKLALPLSKHFETVVALDPDEGMLRELERRCRAEHITNVVTVHASAEGYPASDLAPFRLITCGDSFHWMDRDRVLSQWRPMLDPDGGLAIVGTGGGAMVSDVAWQKAVWRVIRRWLGPERKNAGWQKDTRRFEDILESGGFEVFRNSHVDFSYTRDVQSILGYLYSTSFCNRALLGETLPEFEEDLRDTLLGLEPDGKFVENVSAGYIFARPYRK